MTDAFPGTVSLNFPSASVTTPWFDSLMITEAPTTGVPFVSVTFPVSTLACANSLAGITTAHTNPIMISIYFLMIR